MNNDIEIGDDCRGLIKKRGSFKQKLTNFEKYEERIEELQNVERVTVLEFERRMQTADSLLIHFDELQTEIECLALEPERQFVERDQFENRFHSVMARSRLLLEKFSPQSNDNNDALTQASSSGNSRSSNNFERTGVKLPEIKLPKYDGSYEQWMEFRDIFESLIHNNSHINDIQKYHYLRASLIGSASQVIQSLEFSAFNYEVAWNTICERYNNNRLLIQNHIKAIFDIDKIVVESAGSIRHLSDTLFKHLTSLNQLGEQTDSWSTLIIYIISGKLDNNTAREWEKTKSKLTSYTLDNFRDFLKNRSSLLETIEMNVELTGHNTRGERDDHSRGNRVQKRNISRGLHANSENKETLEIENKVSHICLFCKRGHSLFYCSEFLQLPIGERIAKAKSLKICLNCLRRGHFSKECKWRGCKTCGGKHNTVFHETKNKSNVTLISAHGDESGEDSSQQTNSFQTTNCEFVTARNAILSTARVQVRDKHGKFVSARALLDCGSQSSFMTTDLWKRLKISKDQINLSIGGIGGKVSTSSYKCQLKIRSSNNSYSFDLTCFLLDNIRSNLPDPSYEFHKLIIPDHIILADPEFDKSGPIDMLIGADMFWGLLNTERINLGRYGQLLQNTKLGWIVAGQLSTPTNTTSCHLSQNLQDQLAKFWEVEEVPMNKPLSMEQISCEEHFVKNLKISPGGRYIVSLPLRYSPDKLGVSRDIAVKRLLALERKLMSNNKLRSLYIDFLEEYERLGHMTEVKVERNAASTESEYFMPHHGVLRESRTTTKLRVVFNTSSPSSSGLSLNDLQMTGPTIQDDLLSIILRFRFRFVVLSSDAKMMYRQVLIDPNQRKLQQIVWRKDPSVPLKTFQLNTVTYGTTAASFLAIRCLHEVANEFMPKFPVICIIIKRDMYVDDLLTSVDTLEEAVFVINKISEILRIRGFELRKWKSNDPTVMSQLNNTDVDNTVEFSSGKEQIGKTLGLLWVCDRDILTYIITSAVGDKSSTKITKRMILSRIAAIFDPLGLVSPSIIIAKILLQKLWAEKLSWDQPVPQHILSDWLTLSDQLNRLNTIEVSRRVTCDKPSRIFLHGFADASETSYGACVYTISQNDRSEYQSKLFCAKSRVAPLKTLTIPRLELCAALVLSQMISKVLESVAIKFQGIFCWSDSTIVLGWLKTSPNLLKTFVDNRVAEIQRLTRSFQWRHVPTRDNPADLVSRGLFPNQLVASEMWWHGPTWLLQDEKHWPSLLTIPSDDLPEMRQRSLHVSLSIPQFPFERFSNLNTLKRTVAFMFRFCQNAKRPSVDRNFNPLTSSEINDSFERLLILTQKQSFASDYNTLLSGKELSSNSNILSLHPFIDKIGLLRVGGRLVNSEFSYSKKHPILLSHHHPITKLIFTFEHERLLHAGPQLLLSHVREKYWSTLGRDLVRSIFHKCVKCARFSARTVQPIMGNLPLSRVQPTFPFYKVGVDYAGPFLVKDRRGRGSRDIKCWVCLFICFATRAIHLEMVLSLTTADFLQSFNRFISRRGTPREVFSDNGTYFTKANKDLKMFLQENALSISQESSKMNIEWHFIPANSPRFGGLWEAGVKGVKYHLKRVVGSYTLFLIDFQTLLVRIESVLNSRPLCPLSSSPDDLSALSPSHFLIGRPLLTVPEASIDHVSDNRLTQFQLIQKVQQQFWNRWHLEYISELQQRVKWKRNVGDLKLDQLVLVKDNNLPPMKWRLGRVISLSAGKDGVNRVALVKTIDGLISRAVVRLCPVES